MVTSKEPDLLDLGRKALGNKGVGAQWLWDVPTGRVTVCDEIVRRFGNSQVPALRDRVALRALLCSRERLLSGLERRNKALAAFDEAVRRIPEGDGVGGLSGGGKIWRCLASWTSS